MAKHVLVGWTERMAPEPVDEPSANLRGLLMGVQPTRNVPNYVSQIADGGSPAIEDPDLSFVTVFAQRAAH